MSSEKWLLRVSIIKTQYHSEEMSVSDYISLPQLYRLLNTKMISIGIVGISFLFIFSMNFVGIVIFMITALAIPFSLYMLFIFYTYNKISWIFGFIIWMSISFIPSFLISNDNLFLIAAKFAPLLFFVLYTMFLKMKVGEWLIESGYELETVK